MPRLSDSMEEGVIIGWLVENGVAVSAGDDLVEIETDKAAMTYAADDSGLLRIVAGEGETLPVGAPIARLAEPGEAPVGGDPAADLPAVPVQETGLPAAATAASSPAPVEPGRDRGRRVRSSPLARRVARDLGVDLASLSGSGPGGRIVRLDVERAATNRNDPSVAALAGDSGDETIELNRLQLTVARRMAESKTTVPHFYLRTEVAMDRCAEARSELRALAGDGGTVPSYNDMVVKAVAIALRDHPRMNGSFSEGRIVLHPDVNVGVAVAAEGALVVPVIRDADRLGLAGVAARSRELAAAVRAGTITPPQLSGGTFTVSNLGMFGVSSFDAVINPGQAAILAVGEVAAHPVVRDGELTAGQVMDLTLSCDHRIVYGADGARFLARVRDLLEAPLSLAL